MSRINIKNCLIIGRGEPLFSDDAEGVQVNLDRLAVVPIELFDPPDEWLPPCPWSPTITGDT